MMRIGRVLLLLTAFVLLLLAVLQVFTEFRSTVIGEVATALAIFIWLGVTSRASEQEISSVDNLAHVLEVSLESANQVWWDWNMVRKRLRVGRTGRLCILGYNDCSDLPHKEEGWWDLLHPDDIAGVQESLEPIRKAHGEIRWDHRHRYRGPDGVYRWVHDFGIVIKRDKDGYPVRMIGVTQLIDEEFRARQRERETLARYEAVVEDSVQMICRWKPDFTLTFVNRAYAEAFGKEPEELIGKSFLDLVPEEEHEKVRADVVRLQHTSPLHSTMHQAFGKDGQLRIQQWTDRVLLDEEGQPWEYQSVGMDMTELVTAQREAREKADRYRLAIKAADLCPTEVNYETGEVLARDLVRQMGYDPDVDGKNIQWWYDHAEREDVQRLIETREAIVRAGGDQIDIELRMRNVQGEQRWVLLVGRFTEFTPDGSVRRLVGMARDITPKMRTRLALQAAERQWQATFDAVPDWIAIIDKEHRIRKMNQAMARDLGVDKDALDGEKCYEYLHKTHYVPSFCPHKQTVKDGQVHEREVFDPELQRWSLVTTCPIFDAAGKISGSVHVVRNITEEKEAQLALQRERDMFVSGVVVAVRWKNAEGWPVESISPNVTNVLGYRPHEFTQEGLRFGDIIHEEDLPRVKEQVAESLRLGQLFANLEPYRARAKDGSWYWLLGHGRMERNTQGVTESFLGYVLDITDRVEAEQEARRARDEAQAASEAKSQFLAVMSHELRTPLNPILGWSEILSTKAKDPVALQGLDAINRSAQLLLDLIDSVLHLSRVESGNLEPHPVPIEVMSFLKAGQELFRAKAEEKGLKLVLEGDIPGELRVQLDETLLWQVLINLISNAVKFTKAGSVTLSARREVTDSKQWLCLAVKDTGIGIPESKQDAVWERFTQADSSYTRKYGGTGLGLAIVRRSTELLGGSVEMESTFGKGSEFTVRVPWVEVSNAEVAPSKPAEIESTSRLRVLLVEDEPVNQQVIKVMLDFLGHQMEVACDGEEAVKKAKTGKWDVILMDLTMPLLNGLEATQEIRAMPTPFIQPKIIAMTANVGLETQRECEAAGMNGFISKPASLGKIRSALGELTAAG